MQIRPNAEDRRNISRRKKSRTQAALQPEAPTDSSRHSGSHFEGPHASAPSDACSSSHRRCITNICSFPFSMVSRVYALANLLHSRRWRPNWSGRKPIESVFLSAGCPTRVLSAWRSISSASWNIRHRFAFSLHEELFIHNEYKLLQLFLKNTFDQF